jgi:hypothetical protein
VIDRPASLSVTLIGSLKNEKNAQVLFNILLKPDPEEVNLMQSLFKGVIPKNKKIKNDLYVRMKSINSRGIVKFIFSKPLMQLANYTIIEEKKVINFLVVSSDPS